MKPSHTYVRFVAQSGILGLVDQIALQNQEALMSIQDTALT
jgi:hypothetical protein